ncbi:MAG: DUF1749 domain-containing protein [Actinomycetaceae bacterium]|nr:DUF1749 domain-containing protein [Actinomycetaceae bacterium]
MRRLDVATKRGSVLNGVLFSEGPAETVVIAITGIHGNFYSNPFYVNIGQALNAAGIDFIYAQTSDAFNEIPTVNVTTGAREVIGSWNEDFHHTDEDIEAYLNYAVSSGYRWVILAGHSLGANKVIYYLSRHHSGPVTRFLLLSPANIKHLTNQVSPGERDMVKDYVARGHGQKKLPFALMGWVPCVADTAYQWLFDDVLDNVHVEQDGDFAQVAAIEHTGALLIGTYDRFTYGDPSGFLKNINDHMARPEANQLLFIERTGHTYQGKEQEVAEAIAVLVHSWEDECNDRPRV